MKLRYIANIRLPTEKAHGIQIMSMCSAFASAGAEVELLIPTRSTPIQTDPFDYYGVKKNFTIRTLKNPRPRDLPGLLARASYLFSQLMFARRALADARERPADLYYHRDELVFRAFGNAGLPGIWEVHDMPRHFSLYRKALTHSPLLVAITDGLKKELSAAGVDQARIAVEPDGVDIARFTAPSDTIALRQHFGVNERDVLIVYAGSLAAWKGVDTLAAAGAHLPPESFLLIVGGSGAELESIRSIMTERKVRGIAIGHVPPSEAYAYLQAADIVVIPNSGKTAISRAYTSPLKLFEALAAGKPIVASDLPSLREILDEDVALLVPPDDPDALGKALYTLVGNGGKREMLGARAKEKAAYYDWKERARRILARLGQA